MQTTNTHLLNPRLIQQYINHPGIMDIHVFESLNSTNTWSLKHAACGDVCLAEQQTAGRGRRGRVWHSPQQGNLYLSLKWCFDEPIPHIGLLSLFVGVSIAELLQEEGLSGHNVKWPNDIVWQGKKLGGILLETKGNPQHITIGIGLNIAMQDAEIDQPWISLSAILKQEIDRNKLAGTLLSQLAKRLQYFPQIDTTAFVKQWNHWDMLRGQAVNILSKNDVITAHALGISKQGLLEVRLPNGNKQCLLAADVSIR